MGERKVLNKYYPPDFDPSLLPRNRRPKDQLITVRTMLPMNIQCTSCGEFMYAGKKFNSKKELAQGEDYLGIQVWRFYIKCTMCSSPVTFKTDPKNGNYIAERGCRRNFEPWREYDKDVDEAKREREEEERGDAMKALENRQVESQREMQQLEDLEELREISARQEKVDGLLLLEARQKDAQKEAEEQAVKDEKEVLEVFADSNGERVRRIHVDDDELSDNGDAQFTGPTLLSDFDASEQKPKKNILSSLKLKVVKRRPESSASSIAKKSRSDSGTPVAAASGLVGLTTYNSSSDDSP